MKTPYLNLRTDSKTVCCCNCFLMFYNLFFFFHYLFIFVNFFFLQPKPSLLTVKRKTSLFGLFTRFITNGRVTSTTFTTHARRRSRPSFINGYLRTVTQTQSSLPSGARTGTKTYAVCGAFKQRITFMVALVYAEFRAKSSSLINQYNV